MPAGDFNGAMEPGGTRTERRTRPSARDFLWTRSLPLLQNLPHDAPPQYMIR